MTLRVRALREEEGHRLARMTRSQKLGAGLVRRAQIIQHAVDGLSAPGIAAKMGLCGATVRFWLKRFNERGLPGLEEEMRSGRPPTYTAEERSAVIAAALSRPAELGLPFASWTLDRLVAYLGEKGIGMKRSRVSEVLLAEGLKWRQEETWFGARVDPEFERKRSHGRRTAGLVESGSPLPCRHGRPPMPAYADPTPKPISADTIFLAFELSGTSWLVALHAPDADKVERHRLPAGVAAEVLGLIARTKARVTRRLGTTPRVACCYEAGRDGFWLHRVLEAKGIASHVMDPTSCRSTAVPDARRPIGWSLRAGCA